MKKVLGISLALVVALTAVASGKPVDQSMGGRVAEQVNLGVQQALPTSVTGLSFWGLIDTVTYGGTIWAADSARWEAIRDSVWTFDTGYASAINTGADPNKPVGYHSLMEGWYGIDQSLNPLPYFRRSTLCAIGGSWSFWAGINAAEANALCWTAGQGYGNSWGLAITKTFAYPGTGSVTLEYDYAVDAEPGYDYFYALIDTTGDGSASDLLLAYYTDLTSGHETLTLTQAGGELPSAAGNIVIRFSANADGGYSDEDGLYNSVCGHTAIDNIELSGAITDMATFETGADGWAQETPTTGVGDFSNVVDLTDLPPPVTFCDCAVKDSVLVFYDENEEHPLDQDNIVASPWIDLLAGGDAGRPGKLMMYDVYAEMPMLNYIFVQLRVRYYPEVCVNTGLVYMTGWRDQNVIFYFGEAPFCVPPNSPRIRDYSAVINPAAEQVQLGFGMLNYCSYEPWGPCTGITNTTPWMDDIALGVYGVAGAPLVALLTFDILQDNFAEDGSLNPASSGRFDCNRVKNGARPGPGTILGDTLMAGGDGGNQETRIVFHVSAGPHVNMTALSAWAAKWTPEAGIGTNWYSARMDTAEQGGFPAATKWMACFHEADPGFTGNDRTPDPLDPSQLANEILPDHILTPGSRIDYFLKARYMPPDPRNPGGNSWFLLPDTTGGRYFEVEILPSSMDVDTTWNCVLYVDHHDDRLLFDQQLEEQGLTAHLGTGGNNAEATKYDRFDNETPSSEQLSFGRAIQSNYGASIIQTFAYKKIMWCSGNLASVQLVDEDANVIGPWLTIRQVGDNRFWGTGSGLARSMNVSGEPTTVAFMNNILGVTNTCNTIRDANCPNPSAMDSSYCLPLSAVVGSHFATTVASSGRGNGCPDLESFDLLGIKSGVSGVLGQMNYQKETVLSGPEVAVSYASISHWNTIDVDYKTVLDGVAVGRIRTTPVDKHADFRDPACQVTGASIARSTDVLGWLDLGLSDICRIPTAINDVPGGDVPKPPQFRHALGNAYPNPMNPTTRIQFTNGVEGGKVTLQVFDVTGRLVKTLVNGTMTAGAHEVIWDGSTDSGSSTPSGMYFYKMTAGNFAAAKKLIVMK